MNIELKWGVGLSIATLPLAFELPRSGGLEGLKKSAPSRHGVQPSHALRSILYIDLNLALTIQGRQSSFGFGTQTGQLQSPLTLEPSLLRREPEMALQSGLPGLEFQGVDLPDLIAFMLKKKAVTMFLVVCPTITRASLRDSMRVAVS